MKNKNFLLIFLPFLFLISCKPIQPISISGVNDVKVEEVSLTRIKLNVGMKIKNPNAFGFKIYPSTINFKVNGIDMGPGRITKRTRVKANSEDIRTFYIEADLSKSGIAMNKIIELAKSRSVNIEAKGDIKAGRFFYRKKFPIDVKQRINLGK